MMGTHAMVRSGLQPYPSLILTLIKSEKVNLDYGCSLHHSGHLTL